jgi:hypothetical protein
VRQAGAGVVALFVAIPACSNGPSADLPSDVLWTSAHFDYHTRSMDTEVCPAVLGTLEAHFTELQSYLGFRWPAGTRVDYEKFVDSRDFAAHSDCPPEAGGCAQGTEAESPLALDEHELVHAYLAPTGWPPPVLVEGIAVALSCTSTDYGRPTLTYDQLASTPSGAAATETYSAGAWLVGYILDVSGPAAFMQLYGSLAHDASTADLDTAFRRVLGRGLADVWSAALADSQPRNACVWECSRPAIALDGQPIDTAGACGPEIPRPFTLGAEATIAFESSAASVTLGPCGAVDPPADGLSGTSSVVALYHLPAGAYFVRTSPVPGTLTGIPDASATLSTDCAAAITPPALTRPDANIFVAVPASTTPWYFALPAAGKNVLVPEDPPQPAASADLCSACGVTSCADVSSASVDRGGPGDVLRLTPDPTAAYSGFSVVLGQ